MEVGRGNSRGWRTNSWGRLLAATQQLFHWPQKFKGKDVYDFTVLSKKAQDFWLRIASKETFKAQKKGKLKNYVILEEN